MKRSVFLFVVVVLALMISSTSNAVQVANPIHRIRVFNAVVTAASGNSLSSAIDFSDYGGVVGAFSLQVAVTGSGTCKFEYLLSNDNTNFLEPSTATDIASGVTATSGPGSDGKNIYSFNPEISDQMKIKITETGGANSVTVTAWLVLQ